MGQICQCCIAVVQSRDYQCEHQTSRDLLTDTSSNLAEASEMVMADGGHYGHMVLHRQFSASDSILEIGAI